MFNIFNTGFENSATFKSFQLFYHRICLGGFFLILSNLNLTRMHSNRMRTVHCSSHLLWGCLPRGLSAQGVPSQRVSAQGVSAQGVSAQGCLPRGCLPRGVSAQVGCLPGGFIIVIRRLKVCSFPELEMLSILFPVSPPWFNVD